MDNRKITGILSLRPVKAELITDPRTSSIVNGPQCLLFVGSHRLKTDASNGPLLHPCWNDCFIANVTNENVIHVKVCAMHLSFKTQTLLGQGALELEKVRSSPDRQTIWVDLHLKKEYVGRIQLETRYIDAPKGKPVISCLRPEFDEVIHKKVSSLVLDDLPEEPVKQFITKPKHHSALSVDLYN